MINARQIRRTGLPVFLALFAVIPLLVGQGCPSNGILPWGDGSNTGGSGSGSGSGSGQEIPDDGDNVAPYFEFTKPLTTIMKEVGDKVEIAWLDGDPDDNAVITLLLDPDKLFGNGNEIVIEASISENADGSQGYYLLDTKAKSLQPGEYLIIASITDGINPAEQVVADGLLQLFPVGMVPGNLSPTVVVVEPDINYSVGHNGQVPIRWCVSDPDDGENSVLPDIVILLDLDQNPTNDLVLSGPDAEQTIAEVCFAVSDPTDGPYPVTVNGQLRAYVLGCVKDTLLGQPNACANPVTGGTGFPPNGTYTINAMKILPRINGEPYRVRVTAWDHTNTAVSRYARGTVTVSATATGNNGIVDLAEVGRTIRGTKFYGHDEGGLAGFTGADVGDIDGDGVNDFMIVSRFGRGYGQDPVGSAHLVLGLPSGLTFGQEVSLNSITAMYRGAIFTVYGDEPGGPQNARVTEGIVSVARLDDVTGDGKPEILFGMPYVEALYDRVDDDPCDDDAVCYGDLMPNPLSTSDEGDEMGAFDWRESLFPDPVAGPGICSNDYDLGVQTPISGGYTVMFSSDNAVENGIFALEDMGQGIGVEGARWRGAYLDYYLGEPDLGKYPYAIIPDNLFGTTVASTPEIVGSVPGATARYGTRPLLSMPLGAGDRGQVWSFDGYGGSGDGTPVTSYPWFSCLPGGRNLWLWTTETTGTQEITGEQKGDMLGYGAPAGDVNVDGTQDIACGAPGADRDGLIDNGIVYVVYTRPDFTTPDGHWDHTEFDFQLWNHPRLEIHGTSNNDRFGLVQTTIGDINQDGVADFAFASQYAGSDGIGGPESGFVGIVFGGPHLNGVNVFGANQVGGPTLPGVRIYGRMAGSHAGAVINNIGDFNADGVEDLVIVAPDEIRLVNGLRRQGVAYVLFGGPHLANKTINLSQVGVTVPGLVFITPYGVTGADAAPITWAGGAGDVNGDGFADLLIGIPGADVVYPLNPSLRKIDAGEMYLIYGNNSGSNGMGF